MHTHVDGGVGEDGAEVGHRAARRPRHAELRVGRVVVVHHARTVLAAHAVAVAHRRHDEVRLPQKRMQEVAPLLARADERERRLADGVPSVPDERERGGGEEAARHERAAADRPIQRFHAASIAHHRCPSTCTASGAVRWMKSIAGTVPAHSIMRGELHPFHGHLQFLHSFGIKGVTRRRRRSRPIPRRASCWGRGDRRGSRGGHRRRCASRARPSRGAAARRASRR